MKTSSEAEYEKRLRGRGTDAEEIIERRLANARTELQHAPDYRFQVANDDLDEAVGKIVNIIKSWRA